MITDGAIAFLAWCAIALAIAIPLGIAINRLGRGPRDGGEQ